MLRKSKILSTFCSEMCVDVIVLLFCHQKNCNLNKFRRVPGTWQGVLLPGTSLIFISSSDLLFFEFVNPSRREYNSIFQLFKAGLFKLLCRELQIFWIFFGRRQDGHEKLFWVT
jgi:hypothetical protein